MRCIGCGGEMRLVRTVADHTMMVPGYEHQTLECPGCHVVERRLVFVRAIGPLAVEPMGLPSNAPASTAAPQQSERSDLSRTWTRALERLRSQQSALKERAAAAATSEAVRQLYETWDGFMPRRRAMSSAKKPLKSADKPSQSISTKPVPGKDDVPHGAAPASALARVAAKLRSHQAAISARMALKEHSLGGQPFDQLWENLGPGLRRATPPDKAPTPRPRPLARSRSLVLVEARPGEASSAWARAVAMLRGRQGQGTVGR
jgi:hypothetical protein